jgi:hypothetical protein
MPKITEGQYALGGLTVLAIWLFGVLPFLNSPREIYIQKPEAIEQPAKQSATEPKGTPEAPFFVEVIPAPKSAKEHDQEAEDREEKKSADQWLVRWTAALFFATSGLILATGGLGYFAFRQMRDMKESIAAAKKSADAARTQADAFIAVEAPTFAFSAFKLAEYFFPNGLDGNEVKGRDPVTSAPVPEFMRAIILPTNYGKGALRLLQMCIEYHVGTELPPDPFYMTATGINSVIKQDQADTWFLQPNLFRLDESQRKEIDAGKSFLWVYGFFGYIGLLKDRRIIGFAIRWNHQYGIFIAGGPPAYSYDKQA